MADHAAPSASPAARVAGWTLLRRLGAGAQSQVWLAQRGEQVAALKLQPLDPGAALDAQRRAFLAAAALAASLRHAAIVGIWDSGVDGAVGWLAMEPVPGSDLQRYTRAPRLLPEAVVLQVLQRVAEGLAHAHQRGIVHRDLKPANVLANWADGSVKLVDFGLARSVAASHTGTGVVPGTPVYMSPEQLAGAVPDAASDLYALGVMAYELLAGRLPHEARSMGELLQKVARQRAEPLARHAPAVQAPTAVLVDELLAPRAQRPADAAAVAARLQALQAQAAGRPSR